MIHPDDARELEEIATELGARPLRGGVEYPSETGAWRIGETDTGEWFERFRGQEIVLIAMPIGEATPSPITCGICGHVYDVLGPCPRCERVKQDEAERIEKEQRRRREEVEEMLKEIEVFLASGSSDADR